MYSQFCCDTVIEIQGTSPDKAFLWGGTIRHYIKLARCIRINLRYNIKCQERDPRHQLQLKDHRLAVDPRILGTLGIWGAFPA